MPASEERSISEFPTALSILASTLLLVSTYDYNNDSYDSEKVSAVDLASAILGDFEYTQDLATNVKTIFGAINSIMVLSGTTVPSGAVGSNGQLYFKYTSSGGTDTVDAMYLKINNAWCEVATGGGGGGASVTLGTTVPSDASGSNGDLYVQYEALTYAVINYFVKINNSWRVAPYSKVVALTQAQYDLITPDSQTLYIITDAQSSYQTKTDNTLATADKTVVGAINELKSGNVQEYNTLISTHLNDDMLYSRNGRLVTIACQTTLKTAINANDTLVLYSIGTSANKPQTLNPSTTFISGGKVGMVRIDHTTGDITLYNQSGSNLPISSAINFTITYYAQG